MGRTVTRKKTPEPPAPPPPPPPKAKTPRAPAERKSTKPLEPPVERASKDSLASASEYVTLSLDTGVFSWLREIIDAKMQHKSGFYMPWYKDLVTRAHEQFHRHDEPVEPKQLVETRKPRQVVRRSKS